MTKLIISKEDKPAALAAFYNSSRPQGLGFLHATPEDATLEDAATWLEQGSYFDYLNGRVMKLDFSSNEIFIGLYDRDNGQRAGERALTNAGVAFKATE